MPGHHGLMAGDELDELYCGRPEEFTALRTELAAAAKKRGDADAAKRITSARRPTAAAWVVNRLALTNTDVMDSLTDLRERLRSAHSEMDGAAIRALTTEQRSLVDQLARAAFDGVDMANPAPSLREDVTGTLQAAIADPEVASRLGRLTKAERWSGFGDFGASATVSTTARRVKTESKPEPRPEKPEKPALEEAKAALAAAERAKEIADIQLSDRQTDLAVARLRRDEMRQRLEEAERNLSTADDAYISAKEATSAAAESLKQSKARLKAAQRSK